METRKLETSLKQPQTRFLQLEPMMSEAERETDPDVLTFSVSSELPVERWWGKEVLQHSPDAMNLERLDGMVFLWDHGCDPKVGRRPLGKVLDWKLDGDRSIASIRWSKKEMVQEFRQDVEEGVLTNISFGYQVDDYRVVPGDDDDTVVITRWTPVEISLVSVPADHTVGVGRSWEPDLKPPEPEPVEEKVTAQPETREAPPYKSTIETNNEPIGEAMGTENNEEKVIQFDVEAERAKLRQQESDRIRGIAALCKKHNLASLGDELIEKGTSIDEARSIVLDKIERNYNPVPLGAPLGDANISGFGEREDKQYSLLNALRSICPGFPEYQQKCFEREVSEEIGRKIGKTTAGLYIPVRHLTVGRNQKRDALNTAATAYGGQLVDTELRSQDFIEALRNKAIVFQLGARFLTGLQGNVEIPKQTGVAATYWVGEGGTIPSTDITFGQIGLSPKNIVTRMSMTRQLMLQASLSAEALVREDMVKQIALGVDRAAIYGSGTNNEPRGVLNYAINTLSSGLGADGTAPTYENLVKLCSEIEVDNGDVSTMNWLTNPRVKAKLMLTPMQSSGVEGNFVLKDSASMLGYGFNVSNQVPSNLAKGNGTNLSALILGCWDQLIVAEWGVLEILPNPYGKGYENGNIELRAIKTLDMALRHTESFAALTDLITV
ncbi:phage major capsid protein [Synechocystis sp. FACHB-383]|uniref:phage major capsid protein n=1 Tax=Synechocystis sp. FACHB-383 TaxID=2692864 RepID=UPI001684D686|nr:phage major capsid protein [Synechocystis sp. FACHB-383]MBD2653659.1 phage major capsid protein [Synechocystis sp. FACHB-383]